MAFRYQKFSFCIKRLAVSQSQIPLIATKKKLCQNFTKNPFRAQLQLFMDTKNYITLKVPFGKGAKRSVQAAKVINHDVICKNFDVICTNHVMIYRYSPANKISRSAYKLSFLNYQN